MKLSIVIPARDDIEKLKRCVGCIRDSDKSCEVIVADDASNADIKASLSHSGVSVVRLTERGGPSQARNIGAKNATGDIIVFIDSDVYIKDDTLRKIGEKFENGDIDAVVGVFDDTIRHESFFSDYKNLWMRYTYEAVSSRAALFFTSIAAIKTSVFRKTGGFNERYKRPGIEDTVFGNMLWEMGVRPLIAPEIAVFHDKRYSFLSIFRTDFLRAAGLLKMMLRKGAWNLDMKRRTSVPFTFMASIAVTAISLMLLFTTKNYLIPASLLSISLLLNYGFLSQLYRKRGLVFLLQSLLFVLIEQLCVFLGLMYGFLSYISGRRF